MTLNKSTFSIVGIAVAVAFLFTATRIAGVPAPVTIPFVTHAAFFSRETKQPKIVDPHVFVKDSTAIAGIGPQGIKHDAGLRPALVGEDPETIELYNANGKPLNFNFGEWLGASGSVMITPDGSGGSRLEASFVGLRANGRYSLFENHFDQKPVGFTAMDGKGTDNDFVAKPDGTALVAVALPDIPGHPNAVLLVYHSDGKSHGTERGQIGIDAHHQLIARPE